MNLSKLNDRLQTIASLGVLVGLALVAYELRQTTAISQAEHARETYLAWLDIADIELQGDLAPIIIRSYTEPDQLTADELYKLNSWLISVMSIYVYGNNAKELGVAAGFATIDIPYATYLFGSRFARHWFERNRLWLGEENIETIEQVIRDTPVMDRWPRYDEYYSQ
jgi:hypothetical protein